MPPSKYNESSIPPGGRIKLSIIAPVKVLLVEDDLKLARFLRRLLAEEGYTVDLCTGGEDCLAQAGSGLYSLVILDWMLPDRDGLSVCRELRQKGVLTPILMLTARGDLKERVLGLKTGADDYLVKPFELDELLARMFALIRRTAAFGRLRIGELELDRMRHSALVKGRAIELTGREHAFLLYLAHQAGKPVPRSELLSNIWELHIDPGTNLVDVLVSRLRDKLGEHAWMIDTVRGLGYSLRAERTA